MVSTRSSSDISVKIELDATNKVGGPQEGDSAKFDLTQVNVQRMLVDESMKRTREENKAFVKEEMTSIKADILQSPLHLNLPMTLGSDK
jgi:hypothetical protein